MRQARPERAWAWAAASRSRGCGPGGGRRWLVLSGQTAIGDDQTLAIRALTSNGDGVDASRSVRKLGVAASDDEPAQ